MWHALQCQCQMTYHINFLPDLINSLKDFCEKASNDLHNELAKQALDEAQSSSQVTQDCISAWGNAFSQEHSKYYPASDVSEETAFSKMYHYLILSPALETLLQLENTYALAMQDLVMKRDSAVRSIQEKYVHAWWHAVHRGLAKCQPSVNELTSYTCVFWLAIFNCLKSLSTLGSRGFLLLESWGRNHGRRGALQEQETCGTQGNLSGVTMLPGTSCQTPQRKAKQPCVGKELTTTLSWQEPFVRYS